MSKSFVFSLLLLLSFSAQANSARPFIPVISKLSCEGLSGYYPVQTYAKALLATPDATFWKGAAAHSLWVAFRSSYSGYSAAERVPALNYTGKGELILATSSKNFELVVALPQGRDLQDVKTFKAHLRAGSRFDQSGLLAPPTDELNCRLTTEDII